MPRRTAFALLAVLVVGSSVFVGPFAVSTSASLAWTISSSDFASGTFGNTTVTRGMLQLSPWLAPANRMMVLDVGYPGSPDAAGVFLPFVLRETDGTYKMWYTGNSGTRLSILLALSPDGLHWTRRGVVMDVSNGAMAPFVMKIGPVYHMWFTNVTWCCSTIGYQNEIFHTTSLDGIVWTAPALALPVGAPGGWDADTVAGSWILRGGDGVYRMYYGGWDDFADVRIGMATSPDLVNWTRWSSNPILSWGSSSSWDSASIAYPSVLPGPTWTLMYEGRPNSSLQQIGIATSPDGYGWIKNPGNPVIRPEPSPAWDDVSLGSPDFVLGSRGAAVYYAGGNGTRTRIGVNNASALDVRHSGTYTSAVFDSTEANTTWASLKSVATLPTGTILDLRARAGNVPTPNAAWSPWVSAANLSQLPRTRYAQVAVDFTSEVWNVTPQVTSVTLGYAPYSTPTNPVSVNGWLIAVGAEAIAAALVTVFWLATRRRPPQAGPRP